jgi:hypothetical protein
MKKFRFLIPMILLIAMVLFCFQPVLAVPPIPSSFWGTIKVDGASVPVGTVVSAMINGVIYATYTINPASIVDGETYYSLDVPGEDTDTAGIQGGVEGDTILFFIGSVQATQTGVWHSGTFVNLNLTGYTEGPSTTIIFLPLIQR